MSDNNWGRENNDCRVRYKLSVVVASGETFNPEENEARSPTTKPTSNAAICVNMRDRTGKTRKLQLGYGCVARYWDPFFSATLSMLLFFLHPFAKRVHRLSQYSHSYVNLFRVTVEKCSWHVDRPVVISSRIVSAIRHGKC